MNDKLEKELCDRVAALEKRVRRMETRMTAAALVGGAIMEAALRLSGLV